MSTLRPLTQRERRALMESALQAREASYSPYSGFRVGAALLTDDGRIIKGANVENASSGVTVCAERTAIVKAVSEGTRSFIAVAVTSDIHGPVAPCGICRQVIREFCSLKTPIFLVHGNWTADVPDQVKELTLEELLPYSFGPEDLGRPRG